MEDPPREGRVFSFGHQRKRLIELLREGCSSWGVTLIAPYWVQSDEGPDAVWPGFIPDWGSPKGTLVDVLPGDASEAFFTGNTEGVASALIPLQGLERDPRSYVADMLLEWGYCGEVSDLPDILKRLPRNHR